MYIACKDILSEVFIQQWKLASNKLYEILTERSRINFYLVVNHYLINVKTFLKK